MAYATRCDLDQLLLTARTGVNVLLWFAISLGSTSPEEDPTTPAVHSTLDLDCIARVSSALCAAGLPTTHLVTIGGWNAPHPDASTPPEAAYSAWKAWNEGHVARPGLERGFDGLDWDLEGWDDPAHPNNRFTAACLHLMGRVSQLAKADGYAVSLVPAESYLDPSTSAFDRSLLHAYAEWHPEFRYHGHNTYALLLAKYGSTQVQGPEDPAPAAGALGSPGEVGLLSSGVAEGGTARIMLDAPGGQEEAAPAEEEGQEGGPCLPGTVGTVSVPTFDLVSIQLYETWSHADYNITGAPPAHRQSAAEYLVAWVQQLVQGWWVDFASDPAVNWPSQRVAVPAWQLVIGLANGWAGEPKALLVMPEEAGAAYRRLQGMGMAPRGFVFFDTNNEGRVPPGQSQPLFMAAGINSFLKTRDQQLPENQGSTAS